MVEQVTGGKPLPPEVVHQVVSKADGVPQFVEELTKIVLESGLVREANGHYELTGPLLPLAIPATLHDSLMARLDRLDSTKEVGQYAEALSPKEQARQGTVAARERAVEARTQTEQADAQKRFSQEFAQAQQLIAQGQSYEQQQEFAQALSLYQQVTQRLVKLKQDATLLATRDRAERERRRTTEAKQSPKLLKHWTDANEQWKEAQRLEAAAERAWQGAERAWQGEEYGQAEEQYQQATRFYALARGEAETARQRQQALDAQQQAAQEQALAHNTEAQQYAESLYQRAADSQQRGEQSLTAQHWAQAEIAFRQAQWFFVQARESTQRTKARRLAAEAREKALQAQQEAAEGATLFPQQAAEASAVLMETNRAFAQEDFTAAETDFARSAELFHEIQRAVVLHQQKAQAEQAQAHAREVYSKTLAAKGRLKRRADRALAEADNLLQQGQFAEAQVKYEQVASLFAELDKTVVISSPSKTLPVPSLGFYLLSGVTSLVRRLFTFRGRAQKPQGADVDTHSAVPKQPSQAGLPRRTGSPEVPGGMVDPVHFSVTSPHTVLPGFPFLIDVWAHLEAQREAVIQRAREAIGGGEIRMQSQGPVQVVRGTCPYGCS